MALFFQFSAESVDVFLQFAELPLSILMLTFRIKMIGRDVVRLRNRGSKIILTEGQEMTVNIRVLRVLYRLLSLVECRRGLPFSLASCSSSCSSFPTLS